MKRLLHFRDLFLKYKIALTIFFVLVFSINYVVIKVFIYQPGIETYAYNNNNYNVLGLNAPEDLNFCGEKIPSNDYRIRHALEKEFFTSSYWKTNSIILFNKAQRWFPYIEPILRREGVPDDFKYLAVIESHLSNVTSPAGAAGFWQLVPVSARNYGLEVNELVDERYHLEKSTEAACKHIKEAYGIFKNWTLAAAAYNRGIGGIINALKKQKGQDYYDLLLNPETGAFVYRILAYKTLFTDPQHYGLRKKLRYAPKLACDFYKIDSTVKNVGALARKLDCNLTTLKIFNPWLLQNRIENPEGKTYTLRLPKKRDADFSAYASDLLPEGNQLRPLIAAGTLSSSAAADSLTLKPVIYTVRVDEPIDKLAGFLRVSPEDLRKWNQLKDEQTAVKGQTLMIYYPKN